MSYRQRQTKLLISRNRVECVKRTNNIIETFLIYFLLLRYFSLEEASATIGEKLCVELSVCLSQHGYPPFSAEQKSNLKGQISATMQPDNKVRKLMGENACMHEVIILVRIQGVSKPFRLGLNVELRSGCRSGSGLVG